MHAEIRLPALRRSRGAEFGNNLRQRVDGAEKLTGRMLVIS